MGVYGSGGGMEPTVLEMLRLCIYTFNSVQEDDMYTGRHIHIIHVRIEFSRVNTPKQPTPRSRNRT